MYAKKREKWEGQMNELLELQQKHKLHPHDNEAIFKDIILPLMAAGRLEKSNNPTAIITGGQPGAGKSSLIHILQIERLENPLPEISIDDYRAFHPEYPKVVKKYPFLAPQILTPDANIWANRMRRYCMEKRSDFLLEGTMGNPKVLAFQVAELKQNGFALDFHVLAVNPVISRLSTLNRYAAMKASTAFPRFVTQEAHDERLAGLKVSIGNLADANEAIKLYQRDIQQKLDGSFTDIVSPIKNASIANPQNSFSEKVNAPLSFHEISYLHTSMGILLKAGIDKNELQNLCPSYFKNSYQNISR